jgi:PAS domain S-box-containing protein
VLATVLQLSPDGALMVDAGGRIHDANDLAAELFGYAPDDLTRRSIEDLIPERFRPRHASQRADYSQAPHPRRMGAGLELWGRRRDGTEFPVDVSLAPVPTPAGTMVLAAVRDMTERRSEQADQAQLAAIMESTDDAVIGTDPGGTITSWNPGATRLLQHEAGEIIGQPLSVVVPAEVRADLDELRRRAMAGEHVPPFETRRRRRDGVDIDVEATLSAIRDKRGHVLGVAGVLRDITDRLTARAERARAERQRQQIAMLTDRERIAHDLHDVVIQRLFAAGMRVQTAVQLLADRPEVAARLAAVVDELDGTIADIRTTIFQLEARPTAAEGLRSKVLDLLATLATTLGHEPVAHFDGPIDAAVPPAIAEQVLAVVREALTNVARHAHATTSHVEIAAGRELTVRVTDDGVGIGEPARRSGLRNMGQRAAQLGGHFEVNRRPAGGTEVVWRVPLVD